MRWPWRGDTAANGSAGPRGATLEPIDTVDPETLEVVELDRAGDPVTPRRPAVDGPRELAERPAGHDVGGTAGIWEALRNS